MSSREKTGKQRDTRERSGRVGESSEVGRTY